MILTAWTNGRPLPTGVGYGLRISAADRDAYFDSSWQTIHLALPYSSRFITVPVNAGKASFWRSCRELISKEIGLWLIRHRLAPWPKGPPPRIEVEAIGRSRFRAMRPVAHGE